MATVLEPLAQFEDAEEDRESTPEEKSRTEEVVNAIKTQLKSLSLNDKQQIGEAQPLSNERHIHSVNSRHPLDKQKDVVPSKGSQISERPDTSKRRQALRRSRAFNRSISSASGTLIDTCPPNEKVDDIFAIAPCSTIQTLGVHSSDDHSDLGRISAFDIDGPLNSEKGQIAEDDEHLDRERGSTTSKSWLVPYRGRRRSNTLDKVRSNISSDGADNKSGFHGNGAVVPAQGKWKTNGKARLNRSSHRIKAFGSVISTSSSGSMPFSEDQSSETESTTDTQSAESGFSHLKRALRAAKRGKAPIANVLEAMFALNNRLPETLAEKLYKFLSEKSNLKQSIRHFLSDSSPRDCLTSTYQDCRVASHDGYVIYNAICRGLPNIRQALLKSEKGCNLLFTFIEQYGSHRNATDGKNGREALRLFRVMRILTSLLSVDADVLTKAVINRKGFFDILLQNHLTTPGALDFIVQLFSEDALTDSQEEDLVYGAPNTSGIIHMAQRSLFKTLSGIFISLSKSKEAKYHKAKLQREACADLMASITCRALVTPVFDSTNCSYGKVQMKELNRRVNQLNLFLDPSPLSELVDFGISTLTRDFDADGHSLKTAIGVFDQLLGTIEAARNSKRILTRKMVRECDTTPMEAIIISNLPQLVAVLNVTPTKTHRARLKLAITSLFCRLFASPHLATQYALVSEKVPEALYNTMTAYSWSSIMHSKVIRSVSSSLLNDKAVMLHKAWLNTVDFPTKILNIDIHPPGLRGPLLQIGECIVDFIRRTPPAKVMGLLISEPTYRAFMKLANNKTSELALIISKAPLGGFKPKGGQSILATHKRFTANEFGEHGIQTDGTGVYDI